MLTRLEIRNYTLIDHLELDFGPGFSTLTGETGAGKSILIDALGLLLGDRARLDLIRTAPAAPNSAPRSTCAICPRWPTGWPTKGSTTATVASCAGSCSAMAARA